MGKVLGIHHVTAIARSAQRNFEFYTKVLGLRLVKKTVNFDDPKTYHLYYGNETGAPGTILTFFPWEGIGAGRIGTGMATEISYSVPAGSIEQWKQRFDQFKIKYKQTAERFDEIFISFEDPDGLQFNLIETGKTDKRTQWIRGEVNEQIAIKGFHSITLTLKYLKATAGILTEIFGYTLLQNVGNRYRYITDAVTTANIIDLAEIPEERIGYVAGGTNHHVAFQVEDDKILMEYRDKIASKGFHITPKIDRIYFFSVYFREPGGVLFELASKNPGFMVDEPKDELGTHLKLPSQYESLRADIEKNLIPLK